MAETFPFSNYVVVPVDDSAEGYLPAERLRQYESVKCQ
jgi:hypothetical protein